MSLVFVAFVNGEMFSLFILSLIVLVHVQGTIIPEPEPVVNNPDRIVGGKDAAPGQFPFQVSIQVQQYYWNTNREHYCGGTICNENHIVTAAHCISDPRVIPAILKVMVGSVYWNSANTNFTGSLYEVESLHPHEEFSYYTGQHDIAVIKLKKPIELSSNTKPLAFSSEDHEAGTKCTVSGWGLLQEATDKYVFPRDVKPEVLQWLSVPVVDHKRCEQLFVSNEPGTTLPEITDKMICAGHEEGKNSCNGDSGGPLVCGGKLAGVVSFSKEGCAREGMPTVYTKVSAYKDWLAKHGCS